MKLSIIIPFHRGLHFLVDCLESIRNQDLSDYETVLVLDHVAEDLTGLISSYQDLNLKIVELNKEKPEGLALYIKSEKGFIKDCNGVASARNAGLEAAVGEYIYFVDSDDYILKGTLPTLLYEAGIQDADFTFGKRTSTWFRRAVYLASIENKSETEEEEESDPDQTDTTIQEGQEEVDNSPILYVGNSRKIQKVYDRLRETAMFSEDFLEQISIAYYTLFTSKQGLSNVSVLGILFRRSFLKENNIRFNEQYVFYSDTVFMLRVLQCMKECYFTPEAVYVKRKHNDPVNYPALSQIKNVDKYSEYIHAYREAWGMAEENSPLRGYLEDKFITNYVNTYAPRLRRSENEIWRSDRFQEMHELMIMVNKDKINNLKKYRKKIVKALLHNNVKRATHVVTWHLGIKKIKKIRKNKKLFAYYLYNKVFTKRPIKNNWVIFETFFGKSYSDSPKYIYEYLKTNFPGKYRFIWVINQKTDITGHPIKVKRFSIRYCYYMARCKYFVFNVRQPDWYKKRDGMIFLETWHGTPLKKLVFDQEEVMGASPLYKAQFYQQSKEWDYLVAANKFSSKAFRSAFLFDKEMLEYGYPRNDILNSPDKDERVLKIKRVLKIPEGKKTILYAPTWRDDEYYARGKYKFALKLDLHLLKQELKDDYIVLLRTHYYIADSIDVTGLEDFVWNVSKYNDISELYLISDLLITDYSSVFFDYANLKRPILFFTYDLDKYRDMLRGFYMDIEKEVPGPLLFTNEEVVEAIRKIDVITEEYSEKYETFYERFCCLEDGHASENIVKRVFDPFN
jgi:CDP-glycerol glycerophosphotransferase